MNEVDATTNRIVQAGAWARANLFSSPWNSFLTLASVYLIYQTALPTLSWILLDANFSGESREACGGDGACWVFIKARLGQFVYGFYPEESRWRVWVVAVGFVASVGSWFVTKPAHRTWLVLWSFVVFPYLSWGLLRGHWGIGEIETSKWGGLFLTVLVSAVGIVCSLPLGIVLALGRRSSMPAIRTLSILFIELWRGVPLITVLFMSSVMLPLFFPEGVTFDKLMRALTGVALFSSAYMAEVVRGGLQAIPKGQFEAAKALGLGYWRSTYLVILPQALKLVIPGIVNTFIGLFKDTTLVSIIGMFDLLGIVQAASTDPKWLGYATEGYVFAAVVFWAFCYSMSKYSQKLEGQLNRSH